MKADLDFSNELLLHSKEPGGGGGFEPPRAERFFLDHFESDIKTLEIIAQKIPENINKLLLELSGDPFNYNSFKIKLGKVLLNNGEDIDNRDIVFYQGNFFGYVGVLFDLYHYRDHPLGGHVYYFKLSENLESEMKKLLKN